MAADIRLSIADFDTHRTRFTPPPLLPRNRHGEGEWEQRRFKALDACYRGAEAKGRSGGHCDLKSTEGADPIIYEYRDKQR